MSDEEIVEQMAAQMAAAAIDYDPGIAADMLRARGWDVSGPGATPVLDPEDAEMIADELRALGWRVTPPSKPIPPSWLVERDDGDGFEMLGGGRDE